MRTPTHYLRSVLKDTPIDDWRHRVRDRRTVSQWKEAGKPLPPPHLVKQQIVARHASSFGARTLIETGTFHGDMVYAMRRHFTKIVSVELSTTLYREARRRFQRYSHIEILNGDSGEVLPRVLTNLSEGCVFWLDGHYSAGDTAKASIETPIIQELQTILEHPIQEHVILIDDARLFDGTHDYPTLDDLRALLTRYRPDWSVLVQHDVIRLHAKRGPAGQCEVCNGI